ncbi:MAG: SdrD B-like domain-containing protein [Verrucomicrobiota bacterium]
MNLLSKPKLAFRRGLLVLIASFGFPALQSAPTPGGTEIINQATAEFIDPPTGHQATIVSEPVRVFVQTFQNFTLTQSQSVFGAAGSIQTFAHRLVNSGSEPGVVTLRFANLPGDDFDFAALHLFLDSNRNGAIDPGEAELMNGAMLPLEIHETVHLLIRARLPDTLTPGVKAAFELVAVSASGDKSVANIDDVTVPGLGGLTFHKTASDLAPQRKAEVAFSLVLHNARFDRAAGIPVIVDGVERRLLVLRDIIPPNTTLARVEESGGAQALFHQMGAPLHAYSSVAPPDLASVDAVAFGMPALPLNGGITVRFSVTVNGNASGPARNVAQFYFDDGQNVPPTILDSSRVELNIALVPPFIDFFRNDAFGTEAHATRLNSPLFVQANAAQCNEDATVIERKVITITSAKTQDQEVFTAEETGPNTGVFRILQKIPTADARVVAVVHQDGMIETLRNDTLTASIAGCGNTITETTILIDPDGVLFDSRTDQPIAGATITLIDVASGTPATVFKADGVTPASHTVITDASGRYEFPTVAAGIYRLQVTPPPGYTVPSKLRPGELPEGRIIDPSGSYLGTFPVSLATGAVRIDIPADSAPAAGGSGLFVQKDVSRREAEIGDVLDYTIRIRNVSGSTARDLVLVDHLPAGFTLIKESVRLDQSRRGDPERMAGARLEFALGALADNTTVTLAYRVRVGPGALQGDGVNRAQALAAGIESNVATAQVKLTGGVFTDRGVVIGKVFVDVNHNRVQDAGEPGIPGVRLYLEDGTFVITDSEGKYSLYGLSPRTHVLKVDATTLPVGSRLDPISTRHAGAGQSRFIDLRPGELHKANFAEGSATPEILRQVEERRARGEVVVAEIEKGLKDRLTPDGVLMLPGDVKGLPATGLIGGGELPGTKQSGTNVAVTQPNLANLALSTSSSNAPAADPSFRSVLPGGTLNSDNSNLPRSPVATVPRLSLEQALAHLDNALGFLDLKDGDTLAMPQLTVRVKGPLGAGFALKVNEKEVSKAQIGKKANLPDRQLEAWEFVGVNLRPGTNTLAVVLIDPFGNVRGQETIHVIAPDKLGRIKIVLPEKEQPADGVSPAVIKVLLQDASGVPVTARTPLTLEASAGRWEIEDLDRKEPGVQIFIEGGSVELKLLPPQEPATAHVIISSGALKSEAQLAFLPDLRPMLAVGVIEGSINLSKLNRSALVPARSSDGFDEELREFAVSGNNGRTRTGGRAAFFLKGKIKGEYLLTAGYDSEKATRERLFRDIQPDEFYPVYGDSSIRGFDAQSTGRLYVRIDKKKSYLLYGDFNTQTTSEARGLGNYNRSLTGVKEHFENKFASVNLWASQDSTRQVIEELPANGTSGPYYFNIRDGIVNSEQVEILTRDRNQPSQVVKSEPMTRFLDYEFEPFTGRILFKRPIPSLDSNLNPIFIRVTYEVDQGGDKFWVYGADGQVKLAERVEIGGSAVRDENPLGLYELYSANSTIKLGPRTFLLGEVAQSHSEIGGTGQAGRVELRHKGSSTDARAYFGKTEPSFTNNASILLPGRIESGLKVTQKLNDRTSLIAQGLWTEEVQTHGSRKGVRVDVERIFGPFRMELGVRHSEETADPASPSMIGATPNEVNSVRTKLTAPAPFVKNASLYGEYENDVIETGNRMAALGLDYQLKNRGKLYARHEFISSLGGPFELNQLHQHNTTVVGLESEYMKDGTAFNEYRARDSFSGREAEAATGLRNLWHVAEGVRLNTTLERVTPFNSGNQNEATAVTGAIEYTRQPDWKGTARLELRTSTPNDSLLSSVGYARKVSRDWTFLSKAILLMVDNKGPNVGDKNQGRFQAGFAYRQTESDRWNGLIKYEYKYEEDGSRAGATLRRSVNILSLDVHYQPDADWNLSAHYAGKVALDDLAGQDHLYHAHLVGGRASYEISKRWDVGVNANTLVSGDGRQQQYALGPEIGFLARENLRVGIGYNVIGFRDEDLAADGYTNPGFYLNLRFKFDETLFAAREKKESAR